MASGKAAGSRFRVRATLAGGWSGTVNETGRRHLLAVGDTLYAADSAAARLYVVERGAIRLDAGGVGAGARVLAFLGPGDIFGEEALTAHRHHATAVAAWETSVGEIDPPGESSPNSVWDAVARSLARQRRQTVQRLGDEHLPGLARLARALHGLTVSLGVDASVPGWTRVNAYLPHEALARYVGLNRVTVTRFMGEIARHHAIYGGHGGYLAHPRRLAELEERTVMDSL